MIYFILIWTILIVTCYLIGTFLLNLLVTSSPQRVSDRFMMAIWIGIIGLAVILLAESLIIPLSPLVGVVTIISLGLLTLILPSTRIQIVKVCASLSLNKFLGILILAFAVAMLTTRQVTWSESSWYHQSATRWLTEFGAVQGIVLVLKNLGIVSSWFAFIAPLNGKIISFQAGAVANSFLLFLTLLHLLICLFHGFTNKAKLCDWFIISFDLLFLIYLAISNEMQLILISLSPDLPIILLVGVISWTILVTTDQTALITQSSSIFKLKPQIVPLILAAGALTIKLTALPLLLIASLIYVFYSKFNFRELIMGGIVTFILLLPMVLVGIKTSGCPLYPSPYFCFDLPWSQSLQETQKFADETQSLKKWFGSPPPGENATLWLFLKWLKAESLNQVMAFLILVSFGCSFYIGRVFKTSRNLAMFWLLALAFSGIIFIMHKAPLIRFGLGYMLLLPALSLSIYAQMKLSKVLSNLYANLLSHTTFVNLFQLRIISSFLLGVLLIFSLSSTNIKSRLFLPPRLPNIPLIQRQVNDVTYFSPVQGSCKASELPCTPNVLYDISLHNSALGIKAGFVRTDMAEPPR